MLSKPRRACGTATRIIAVAVVIALLFVYANFSVAAHDPLWWKHVGLKDRPVAVKPTEPPPVVLAVPDTKATDGNANADLADDIKEKEEIDRLASEAARRIAQEVHARLAKEKADRLANEDADRKAKEEADRWAKEETDRKAKEDADRVAKEEAERKMKAAAADVPEVPGLVRGVDYFADYDIRSVQIPQDPVGTAEKPLKFQYMNTSTAPYPFYWISSKPRVAYIPNFMTDEECDLMIKTATPRLQRSLVAVKTGGSGKPVDDVRTSSQTWMDVNTMPAKPIADRIFQQAGFKTGSSEMMQILRYELTQKYDAHQDYFSNETYGPIPTDRAVTVFLYFTTVEEGGETWFPGADNKPVLTQDYKSCKGGFGFKPRKRDAVVFYDMTPRGGYDPWSLHGGCPVKKGTKWGGTLWLRVRTIWAPELELADANRKAKEEADRKAVEEANRLAKDEADRKAKEDADRVAKEEAERKMKAAAADVPEVPGLVRGVDYFADYDIRSVQIPQDPVGTAEKPLKFQYMNTSTAPYPFYWISSKPRVAYIPNFMTDEECDAVVKTATPRVERSQVAIRPGDTDKNPVNEVRTSSQAWLDPATLPVKPIADRIFQQTGFRPGTSEMMQILRYELTQKYDAHQDYFDPQMYGPQSDNRAVTVFLYFTTVEEGGETWFPGADNKPVLTQDYKSCKGGFGFKPRKRDAVLFYDMTPTGGYEPYSLHGGCPVKKGTKWGGTLWLRVPTT